MAQDITSVQNPRVKQWTELLVKRGRDRQGKFLLEGVHLVEEALRSGIAVETILYSLDKGLPKEVESRLTSAEEVIGVSQAVLAKCSDTQTPQGVLGIAAKPDAPRTDSLTGRDALVVAVDGIQDPGNLGTIIRTADAAGATAVILGRGTVDVYNPKTIRSTMGSLFHLPVVEADLPELLAEAGKAGVQVLSTGMQAEDTCYTADLTQATWFVIGNEGSGVSSEAEAHVSRRISIPMRGRAESLNAAMAAGIVLYEAMRQRHYK
ncbi:RNA methyltransferase [Paenibacillus aurantius]|uniref:RNA methyltransferase n=1 Tax=Paenibacillus aurantius TaxID=2918900 RepID=A0AA96LEV0_9BACL|nr:RNA methyltransferase [Paenibacillus aurantius]WNQ12517.1 RNA methyltransferase [Paenibacillus aurantius]